MRTCDASVSPTSIRRCFAGLILYTRCAGHCYPGDVPHLIIGYIQQPVGPPGTSHSNLQNVELRTIWLHAGLNWAPSEMMPSYR